MSPTPQSIVTLRTWLNNRYLVLVARLLVGGVFTGAGIVKLLEPIEEFIAIGQQWDILPDPWITWFMTILPWLELILGLSMLFGLWQRYSAASIAGLLVIFLTAIIINLVRGRTLEDCGCFGGAVEFGKTFTELLWRDGVLLVLSLIVVKAKQTWLAIDKYL